MQTQRPKYKQTDATTLITEPATHPGAIQGFVASVTSATVLTLNPSVSRLDRKAIIGVNDVAQDKVLSVALTKQGVYIEEDSPYTITNYPAGTAGQFRVDALVLNHKYLSSTSNQTAVMTVLQGTSQATADAAWSARPNTNALPTHTFIGWVRMTGVDLTTATVEIQYTDPTAYHEFLALSNFVGVREVPASFNEAASEIGRVPNTINGAVYGMEKRLNDSYAELLALMRQATPQGAIVWTTDLPSSFFDTTGRGIANTKWARWAICNGQNGTPNMAGRVTVAYDASANPALDLNIADNPDLPEAVKAQLNYARPGNTGGGNTKKISIDQMPSHNHGGTTTINTTSLDHTHELNSAGTDSGAGAWADGDQHPTPIVLSTGPVDAAFNDLQHVHGIPPQGGGQAFDVRQPYIVLIPVMFLGF